VSNPVKRHLILTVLAGSTRECDRRTDHVTLTSVTLYAFMRRCCRKNYSIFGEDAPFTTGVQYLSFSLLRCTL